ncbi:MULTISPECIES: hypothetical protein [Thalassotalea]|uniref:hypothetical protein n=1 Tax=Thalassotalea TaxID=1518149 RepID=UPI0009420BA2|nr:MULTISPECIES: hypothetical protein [Thalassotalea]OKY27182.1 hypothetical protein BI291_09645 [Thalassotalea sp. PP2-459]
MKISIMFTAILLGLFAFVNGVLMTFSPDTWYWLVPGVPDRGPFNQHFIRDIGIIYLLIGIAFIYGALLKKHSVDLWVVPTLWLTGHAIFHIWEVYAGICNPEALIDDFAGVIFPAMIAIGLIYLTHRTSKNA